MEISSINESDDQLYMPNKLTKTEIVNRLKKRNIDLIDEFINTRTKSLFRCHLNHEWLARVSRVLEGSSCPHCNNNFPLTKNAINDRLIIDNRNLILVDEVYNTRSKHLFRCSENHEFSSILNNVLRGRGCPICAEYGFKASEPAHVYVLKFDNFIKYGITNRLNGRLHDHAHKNGNFKIIIACLFENGHDALAWENSIKKMYGKSYVTKEICPDGFTETLPLLFIQPLIDSLHKQMKYNT